MIYKYYNWGISPKFGFDIIKLEESTWKRGMGFTILQGAMKVSE